jgi:hypothetical protein
MGINLSPEEILRKKEIEGGLEYDDPKPIPEPIVNPVQAPIETSKVEIEEPKESKINPKDLVWKNLPLSSLPSKGLFYPEGTKIAIRPALVKEIKYFSTIDETDELDIEEKLSYILDMCSMINFPSEGVRSYLDFLEDDRFFIILAIRDLTFIKGENSIMLMLDEKCKDSICPFSEGIELRTGTLGFHRIESKVMEYFSSVNRNFHFRLKDQEGTEITMYLPTIGVNKKIDSFIRMAIRNDVEMEESDLKIIPYLFGNRFEMSYSNFIEKLNYLKGIEDKTLFSVLLKLSESLRSGTKTQIVQDCPKCGAKGVTAEISFPGGIRSLFVVSDIFGKLF